MSVFELVGHRQTRVEEVLPAGRLVSLVEAAGPKDRLQLLEGSLAHVAFQIHTVDKAWQSPVQRTEVGAVSPVPQEA